MSELKLRNLRIFVAWLATLHAILFIAIFIKGGTTNILQYPFYISDFAISILFAISYCLSLIQSPHSVHPFLRAFLLFGLVIFHLKINIEDFIVIVQNFICPREYPWCFVYRTKDVIAIILGFLIIFEVALTIKYGRKNSATNALPHEAVIISPLPVQPLQQSYHQQQQQGYYYPQLQQQQPMPLQQLNQQGQLMPSYQQPYYQAPAQLQQQQHGNIVGHHPPPPQVPGSMITTTPQPGAQPIAPYASPGTVALSPVMPAEAYPMPSNGGSSPLPPHPIS